MGWRDIARARAVTVALAHGVALATIGLLIVGRAPAISRRLVRFVGFHGGGAVLATSLYVHQQGHRRGLSRRTGGGTQDMAQLATRATSTNGTTTTGAWSSSACLAGAGGHRLGADTVPLSSTCWRPCPSAPRIDFVHHVVLAADGWLFEVLAGPGGVMAAPLFASSVVASAACSLDRRRRPRCKPCLTSWQAVLEKPRTRMASWARRHHGLDACWDWARCCLGLVPGHPDARARPLARLSATSSM